MDSFIFGIKISHRDDSIKNCIRRVLILLLAIKSFFDQGRKSESLEET